MSEKALRIKSFALSLGFDDVGFAAVDDDLPFTKEVATAALEGRFGPIDYLHKNLETRLNVRAQFPEAKSAIVVVKNYYTGDHVDYSEKASNLPKIARYAWGKDYHQWFKKKLGLLRSFLETQNDHSIKVWAFNDTAPVLERAWAFKAGLGFLGKSGMFIHRRFGTWTLLGGMFTDLIIQPNEPYQGPDCGSCTRCIDACPPKAIIRPKMVDANKCISTWTIERPLHPEAFSKAPRNHQWAFGCDICQEVCPWNKFETKTDEPRFAPLPGRIFLAPETFQQDLRGSPLYRSKKPGLLANLLRIQSSLHEPNMKQIMGPRQQKDL